MEQQRLVDGLAHMLREAPRGTVDVDVGVKQQEQRQAG